MSIAIVRDVLFWCFVLNLGLLVPWAATLLLPHGWVHRVWCGRLHVTPATFDAINLGVFSAYKSLVFFLNVVPYLAIRLATG